MTILNFCSKFCFVDFVGRNDYVLQYQPHAFICYCWFLKRENTSCPPSNEFWGCWCNLSVRTWFIFNYAFLHFSLQSCLCSLHIPTIQCPNSQCNEQANAGIKRIKDQHSYHRCKPQPNIQSSSSFDCGWVRRVFLVFHFSYWPMRVKRGQKMTFVSLQDTQSQTSLLYMFMMQ